MNGEERLESGIWSWLPSCSPRMLLRWSAAETMVALVQVDGVKKGVEPNKIVRVIHLSAQLIVASSPKARHLSDEAVPSWTKQAGDNTSELALELGWTYRSLLVFDWSLRVSVGYFYLSSCSAWGSSTRLQPSSIIMLWPFKFLIPWLKAKRNRLLSKMVAAAAASETAAQNTYSYWE